MKFKKTFTAQETGKYQLHLQNWGTVSGWFTLDPTLEEVQTALAFELKTRRRMSICQRLVARIGRLQATQLARDVATELGA
jgi:hypothetical protein